MSCLAAETLARFDVLDEAERARMWAHAEVCPSCARQLSELVVESTPDGATRHLGSEAPAPAASPTTDDDGLVRGTMIGRYVVLQRVGSGGLGEVYAAYDPELDRKIALKLLKPSASSAAGSRLLQIRLQREAQAMARLSHPNVVSVYDVGTVTDRVFIAMELIEGRTLRQWLKESDRSWREVRDVFVQVGHGVAAAHDAGLVHRDLKPGNILIASDGRVKVLDFGLARGTFSPNDAAEEELTGEGELETPLTLNLVDEAITRTGQFMGTPAYMAPEQYDAEARLDHRVDQFGFCVTLHQALWGIRPFRGQDVRSIKEATLAGRISEPSNDRGVPKWLRQVVLRGLAGSRENRFPDMRSLVAALEHDRQARRRGLRLGVAAAVIVGFLGGAGAVLASRAEPEVSAVTAIDRLVGEARAAAAQAYYVYPPSDDPDRPTAYTKVLELENLEDDLADAARSRAVELRGEFAGTLTRLGDDYWRKEGGKPFAIDFYAWALVFDRENARARERSSVTPGELAELRAKAAQNDFTGAELLAADSLVALAEDDEAERKRKLHKIVRRGDETGLSTTRRIEKLLGESVTKAEPATAAKKPKPDVAPTRQEPDPVVVAEASKPAPTTASPQSTHREDREVKRSDPAAASRLVQQARAAAARGDLSTAESLYHRAIEADRDQVDAIVGLAELAFERGAYRQAVSYAQRAVAKRPKTAGYRILLGDAYFKTLAYGDARREYEQAKALGHADAAGRLGRLDQRVGK